LYFAAGGDRRWRLADGWLSELDECGNWYTTSAVGTFPCNKGISMELSLRDMNLVGNIPNEIGLLRLFGKQKFESHLHFYGNCLFPISPAAI